MKFLIVIKYFICLGLIFASTFGFSGEMEFFNKSSSEDNIFTTDEGIRLIKIDDMYISFDLDDQSSRNKALGTGANLWPGGILLYQFASNLTSYQKQQFIDACALWSSRAKVSCQPRTPNHRAYIYIQNSNENSSFVGRLGSAQPFKIYNWNQKIIIAHEIAHALGFEHEQSRTDRDLYVNIYQENIIHNAKNNFVKSSRIPKTKYNFDSIMHYDAYAFSKNGRPTILPKPEYASFKTGQRRRISELDYVDMIAEYGERRISIPTEPPSIEFDFAVNGNQVQITNIPRNTEEIDLLIWSDSNLRKEILTTLSVNGQSQLAFDIRWEIKGKTLFIEAYDINDHMLASKFKIIPLR